MEPAKYSATARLQSDSIYNLLGAPSPFDPTHKWVTSPIFNPSTLAIIRLSLAGYTFFTALFTLIWDSVHNAGNSHFCYFTDLSYIGLVSYFAMSSVQTFAFARSKRAEYPLQRWPRFLQFLYSLLFSTIITFPFIVTFVVITMLWTQLSSLGAVIDPFFIWSNISQHAMNSVFALFEIFFTHGGPTPWTHMLFLILFGAGYLGVAYITHDTQHFYTYSFLNPTKEGPFLALYIVSIAVGFCLFFAITRSACVFRERICTRSRRRSAGSCDTGASEESLETAVSSGKSF